MEKENAGNKKINGSVVPETKRFAVCAADPGKTLFLKKVTEATIEERVIVSRDKRKRVR